jgi:hypothetical protein
MYTHPRCLRNILGRSKKLQRKCVAVTFRMMIIIIAVVIIERGIRIDSVSNRTRDTRPVMLFAIRPGLVKLTTASGAHIVASMQGAVDAPGGVESTSGCEQLQQTNILFDHLVGAGDGSQQHREASSLAVLDKRGGRFARL